MILVRMQLPIRINPKDSNKIAISTFENTVMATEDGGKIWTTLLENGVVQYRSFILGDEKTLLIQIYCYFVISSVLLYKIIYIISLFTKVAKKRGAIMCKILLVDDEPLMLNLLELYLNPYGFNCVSMTSGYEALVYLQREHVDLIIMDVMLPGKDGWETTREIREFSNIPIIVVTARDQAVDIISSINSGANGHISKPIEEHTLIKYVNSLIEEKKKLPPDL